MWSVLFWESVFWVAVLTRAYAYLGYPLTLVALRSILKRGVHKQDITPRLSLLMPAFNETSNIRNFVKDARGEVSSALGGHGHLHAIRAELYPFPPPGTILGTPNPFASLFFFVCHKGLRLVIPFAMIAAFVPNVFLLIPPMYQVTFAAQTTFYILAICGALVRLRLTILMLAY